MTSFVLDGFGAGHREEFYAVKAQRDLADDEFLARVDREINKEPFRPPTDRSCQIEAAVCRQCELPVDLLKSRSEERRGSFGRGLAACLGQELGGIALNQVAGRYDRDPVTLSPGLKALTQKIGQDCGLRRGGEKLLSELRTDQKSKMSSRSCKDELHNAPHIFGCR